MPTYEYRCANCGFELEEIQSIKADPLTHCPNCGEETLKRIISGGNALIFKGSGFYLTDYKNKSGEPAASKKEAASPAPASKSTETTPKTETKTETKKGPAKTDPPKSSASKKTSEK